MKFVVAVLDTMWDWRAMTSSAGNTRTAPRFFSINPRNFSGRRLYSLVGIDSRLLVTNACRELVKSAKEKGTPDPVWLYENLTRLSQGFRPIDIILVCGKTAQATYKVCNFKHHQVTRVIEIPHPAARVVWNKEYLEQVRKQIQGA